MRKPFSTQGSQPYRKKTLVNLTASNLLAGLIGAVALLATAVGPAGWTAKLVVPFLLASTVEGLLLGSAVPKKIATFVHPLITCSVFVNLSAALFAAVSGWSYKQTLQHYITKASTCTLASLKSCISLLLYLEATLF